MLEKLETLKKALEAGNYNAQPSSLVAGASLQMEDLSNVMQVTTFGDKAIKLQKLFKVTPARGTLVQFNRQLDYGVLGGSAVLEGAVGQEETSSFVRAVVPMSYYVHVRRVTMQAQMVQTFDGIKAEDRAEADASIKLQGDIEFHLFRGKSAYSNAGLFDGNPLAMSDLEPGMHGLDPQIRVSDYIFSTQDLMLNEYGSDVSVAINQNGALQQSTLEDVYARSQMRHGAPSKFYLDPLTHASYNKIAYNKERIVLAGSPQKSHGASLNEQWVADGVLSIESSRFLSGKTQPGRSRVGAPSAPTMGHSEAGGSSSFIAGEAYIWSACGCNELGEGPSSAVVLHTITANGAQVTIAITPSGAARSLYFNVYRTVAGGTARKFIGRVKANGSSAVNFIDLNNRIPGFVTGFALDDRGIDMPELSPFKSIELARTDLTIPKAFFRFLCCKVMLPRFHQIVDNLS